MDDRSWMDLKNRTCEEYLNGLKSFIRAAELDMLNQRKSDMFNTMQCSEKRRCAMFRKEKLQTGSEDKRSTHTPCKETGSDSETSVSSMALNFCKATKSKRSGEYWILLK